MTLRFLAFALAPLPLTLTLFAAACAPADPETAAVRSAAAIAAAPEATVIGDAQTCIDRAQIRNTAVHSDQVIDFEMQGGTVYRNILAQRCPGLGMDRAINYQTSLNQLCRQQIVYTLQNIGGVVQRGGGCSLGDFVPVDYVKREQK